MYSIYENGIYQPYFSIVAKNANAVQKDEFVATIEDELARIVKEGLDKKALLAGLNYYEFKYREADFGSYPKGLMYGLQMFDSWLYDDNMPFDMIEANAVFKFLREKIETDYYEQFNDIVNEVHANMTFKKSINYTLLHRTNKFVAKSEQVALDLTPGDACIVIEELK